MRWDCDVGMRRRVISTWENSWTSEREEEEPTVGQVLQLVWVVLEIVEACAATAPGMNDISTCFCSFTDQSLTEVSSLPGSPIDERHEMSSLPRGTVEPGGRRVGTRDFGV